MGNTDIEDSLDKLDKLTQEEERMASVELLKMMQSINGKVMGVDDRVKGVEGKVQDVCDDIQDVHNDVQSVCLSLDLLGFSIAVSHVLWSIVLML